jgi:uncharacterized protein (TIGR03437 family)
MKSLTKLAIAALSATAGIAQPPPGGGPPPGGSGNGIWLRNAYFGEKETFDACLGHQPGTGEYHHHVQPVCLRAQLNDNVELVATGRTGSAYREKSIGWTHSPILGWALDGYPIYGPYGYIDSKNASSAAKRMKSSFRLRNISQRDSLPDWALPYHSGVSQQLSAAQTGPAINETFPLGRYVEDFEYIQNLGDLDQYNGRFTITPDFPSGTYAYFITLNEDGTPAFPFILGLQFYGSASGGTARTIPTDAQDYFANGKYTGTAAAADAQLKSFYTKNSQTIAQAVVGWDPSAGPQATWPGTQPAGARSSGGVTAPTNADVQRIRITASTLYVNSNNLPSYIVGPWFASMNGGVFGNFPSSQNTQMQLPRAPQTASAARTNTGLGAIGIWANGVAVFNAMDGASYSNATGDDAGGGIVTKNAVNISSASLEGGPVTPGALVTAYANFDAKIATSTEQAATPDWPLTLGGATVTIKDAAGVSTQAAISYASPKQINYRVPENAAVGIATVSFSAGGATVPGYLNIVSTYPGLFKAGPDNLAAAQVARIQAGKTIYSTVATAEPIAIGPASEQATLILYGTGLNAAKDVSVTIGGVQAQVAYAGPQGTYAGLDQIDVPIPQAVSGKGRVDVIVTAGGKPSNWVNVIVQ